MDACDVVVVGGGAAGIAAARAAHETGARVVLVDRGTPGATAWTAGWIEAGAHAGDALAGLIRATGVLRPWGAYSFVTVAGQRVDAVSSGLASLLDLATIDGPVAVVDLVAGPAWSPSLVARSLPGARVVKPDASMTIRSESARELARQLDTAGLAEALGASLREAVRGCAAVLFPPVLGLLRDDVASVLARAVGVAHVGEVGGAPGDPPAVRLARALDRALPAAVTRVRGHAHLEARSERAHVRIEGHGTLDARAVVLATGGLAGGGIAFDGAFAEPCSHAPVWIPSQQERDESLAHGASLPVPTAARGLDPAPLFTPDEHGRIDAARAGVRIANDGPVLASDGVAFHAPWLFAAGAVVCVDASRRPYGLALGDALASGSRAGALAARHATRG